MTYKYIHNVNNINFFPNSTIIGIIMGIVELGIITKNTSNLSVRKMSSLGSNYLSGIKTERIPKSPNGPSNRQTEKMTAIISK